MRLRPFFHDFTLHAVGIAVLGFACISTQLQGQVPHRDYIIGLQSSATSEDLSMVRMLGGEVTRVYRIIDAIVVTIPETARQDLDHNPRVRYIEEDVLVYALAETVPWGISRVFSSDERRLETWGIAGTGSGIRVAILDTGIDDHHEDLQVSGGRNFSNVGGANDWQDAHGHGTHVAGTVAALWNSIGVVGVAPDVALYSLKVLNDSGQGQVTWLIDAIEWAEEEEIDIINMSLQGYPDSQSIQDAIASAFAAGVLLIAAAGNFGVEDWTQDNVQYPGRFDNVIAVGASDRHEMRAQWPITGLPEEFWPWSSTGPDVDLIAPGKEVLSTVPFESGSYWPFWDCENEQSSSLYHCLGGTSMAAPHVAGTAALVWAMNPSLSNAEVRQRLFCSAEDIGLQSVEQGLGLIRPDLAIHGAPGWWAARGIVSIEGSDDYSVANQGQLKHIAKRAYDEFEENLPGGAGAALEALVSAWGTPGVSTDDYRAINLGQLKHVAALFYDRLIEEEIFTVYPWSGAPDDFALANLGQMKNLFSFCLHIHD